jgi:hypothetical protein
MPIRTQEHLFGFSYGKQTNISTVPVIGKFWRLNKLNPDVPLPQLGIETDAAEMGKGDEFTTQTFQMAWSGGTSIRKYLTSQFAAWVLAFGLGKVTVSGSGSPYTYTITPQNPTTDGIELPYFSGLYQYRASVPALDQVYIGCALEDFTIQLNSGPGKQNSQASCNYVMSGKFTDPSGLTMPAATPEAILPAGLAQITLNGVDYVANKNLISLTFSGKNNLMQDAGFYVGSGFQTAGNAQSGAIRGRLEFGNRKYSLSFVTRFNSTSAEFAALKAQTTGTGTITLTADANNSLTINFYRISYNTTVLADSNGLVTVQVDCECQRDPTNGVLSATVITTQGGIGV